MGNFVMYSATDWPIRPGIHTLSPIDRLPYLRVEGELSLKLISSHLNFNFNSTQLTHSSTHSLTHSSIYSLTGTVFKPPQCGQGRSISSRVEFLCVEDSMLSKEAVTTWSLLRMPEIGKVGLIHPDYQSTPGAALKEDISAACPARPDSGHTRD